MKKSLIYDSDCIAISVATMAMLLFAVYMGFLFLSSESSPNYDRDISFRELIDHAKEHRHDWRPYNYWNGTVIWYGEERSTKVIVVIPVPIDVIDKENLTTNDYLPVQVNREYAIGDLIMASGPVKEAKDEDGNIFYYLDANHVQVIGKVDVKDPDFQEIAESIHQKMSNDFFWIWFWFFSPMSPFSPFNPIWSDW